MLSEVPNGGHSYHKRGQVNDREHQYRGRHSYYKCTAGQADHVIRNLPRSACRISDACAMATPDRIALPLAIMRRSVCSITTTPSDWCNRHIYLQLECNLFVAPSLLADTKAKLRSHGHLDMVGQLYRDMSEACVREADKKGLEQMHQYGFAEAKAEGQGQAQAEGTWIWEEHVQGYGRHRRRGGTGIWAGAGTAQAQKTDAELCYIGLTAVQAAIKAAVSCGSEGERLSAVVLSRGRPRRCPITRRCSATTRRSTL